MNQPDLLRLFVTAPPGVSALLAAELEALGAKRLRAQGAGVACMASLASAYRIVLWSRLASRVLVQLGIFEATDADALYRGASALDWPAVFDGGATFAVRVTTAGSAIGHSGFAAQRVKDAIVDSFRAATGTRPSVDRQAPDISVHLYAQRRRATLALDLAGASLHRRGYRGSSAAAPLKENLAAAILALADWPRIAHAGGTLLDPMCGSGTLLTEGILIAANAAPGLLRDRFGFEAWAGHDPGLWTAVHDEARAALRHDALPAIVGADADPHAVEEARASRDWLAETLGIDAPWQLRCQGIDALDPAPDLQPGLVVTNPPYGERLAPANLPGLYAGLGRALRRLAGWRAVVFSANAQLMHRIRLTAVDRHPLRNGALECVLHDYGVLSAPRPRSATAAFEAQADEDTASEGRALANRLRKNARHLARWLRREQVECYRVYDADLPEFAFAIDRYAGSAPALVMQEYQAPASVDSAVACRRARVAQRVAAEVLEVAPERVFMRRRSRQRGAEQYERLSNASVTDVVEEHGLAFEVNFTDYLDTGLFLDHRITRARLRSLAAGRRFLNLFAYTGSASVHAAAGGALSTTSVDMSRTYLDWAGRNLALNGFTGEEHALVQADCLAWLRTARARFALIFVDPPSFSNSKRMRESFDVQRDHAALLHAAGRLLAPEGVLVFATNRRRFELDEALEKRFVIENTSRATRPPDFARGRAPHQSFELRLRAPVSAGPRGPERPWPSR